MIFLVVFISLISALLTFEFGNKKNIGAVRASSALTLFAYIDLILINTFYPIDVDYFLTVFFGASFVGMSARERFTYLQIAWASFIYSLLFLSFLPLLKGLGGALGLSAFISIVIIHLIQEIFKNIKTILTRS